MVKQSQNLVIDKREMNPNKKISPQNQRKKAKEEEIEKSYRNNLKTTK